MNVIVIGQIFYLIILVTVCIYIIFNTRSSTKAISYLLLAVFLPVAGMILYFLLGGINYRNTLIYSKKLIEDEDRLIKLNIEMEADVSSVVKRNLHEVHNRESLVKIVMKENMSPLTDGNSVKILINGEKKFPEVFEAIDEAKNHVHIEYFIFENDKIGNEFKKLLIHKARQGVNIRFIYDDFGSRNIRRNLVSELRAGGVEAYPFNRIRFMLLANRINYRNHRKIIIVDGNVGFTGGINVSDKYINDDTNDNKIFWRDTHLRIDGPGILYLQHIFLCDWNFCSNQKIIPNDEFFNNTKYYDDNVCVQIAASGPDSPNSTIMLTFLRAITLAEKEIMITTPYFYPESTILNALKMAALGGVNVKIIIPYISDYKIINTASRSYFDELLNAGVEIYLYKKGFIHSKTMVIDRNLASVGTANMNHRSMDLDFEATAMIYNNEVAGKLTDLFYKDLEDSEKINIEEWKQRPLSQKFLEKSAKLLSPFL